MTASCLDMIKRGMRLCGALGAGEEPDDQEAEDGRTVMNSMLDSWSIERLFVSYMVEETLTLVANQTVYTMGAAGDLNTTRPTKIEDQCFIRYASVDTPLSLLTSAGYAAIIAKTIGSNIPMWMFPDMQFPLVRLSFYPVPSTSAAVAHIFSWKQLQTFEQLTETISLPPGYQRMIEFSFAEEYAAEFGLECPPTVPRIAARARANVKRINATPQPMRTEVGVLTSYYPPGRNIYTG